MASSDIRSALESLSNTIAAQPEKAKAKHGPATATIERGLACSVTGTLGERIETDMPPAMGGAASGPNPGWFFRAAIASCCATVIAMRAAQLGISLSKLEVTVESDGDNRGILGLDNQVSAGASALRTNVRIGADNAARGLGAVGREALSGRLHRPGRPGKHAQRCRRLRRVRRLHSLLLRQLCR